MASLKRLIEELKRRRVFRVAVMYTVVAFVVWQAAEIAVPGLNLPDWVLTLVILLTVLGFPIALAISWCQQNESWSQSGNIRRRTDARFQG